MRDREGYDNLVPKNGDHRKGQSHALGGEGGGGAASQGRLATILGAEPACGSPWPFLPA